MRLVTFTHGDTTRVGALNESGDVMDLAAADPVLSGDDDRPAVAGRRCRAGA